MVEDGTAEDEDGTVVAEGQISVGKIGEEPDLEAGVVEGGTAVAGVVEDGTAVAEGQIVVGKIGVEPGLVAEVGTVIEAGTAVVGTAVFVETGLAELVVGLVVLVDVGLAEYV